MPRPLFLKAHRVEPPRLDPGPACDADAGPTRDWIIRKRVDGWLYQHPHRFPAVEAAAERLLARILAAGVVDLDLWVPIHPDCSFEAWPGEMRDRALSNIFC